MVLSFSGIVDTPTSYHSGLRPFNSSHGPGKGGQYRRTPRLIDGVVSLETSVLEYSQMVTPLQIDLGSS